MKVFSLKKFISDMGETLVCEWVKQCDGQPTDGISCTGKNGVTYIIHTDWCEEVPETKVIFNGNATVLIKDGKKYVSKCKDGDEYDKEKGLLLCLAQANGISYRDLQEMIAGAKDCKNDKAQVREVKRHAKEGEYIKIVKEENGRDSAYYKNGDILKVKEPVKSYKGDVRAYYEGVGNTGLYGHNYIEDGEYVVLENYKPYKITLSEFWANKREKAMAIHCKTEGEAKELLKAFDKAGECWRGGDKYTEKLMWNTNEEKMIYCNDNGFARINGLWVEDAKATIYEFNEVDLEH